MTLTHGHSEKSYAAGIPDMLPTLLSGILLAVAQFPFLLKKGRFSFFGHVVHLDPRQDHQQAISVALRPSALIVA